MQRIAGHIIFICILTLLIQNEMAVPSHGALNMDEIRSLYEKEKSGLWEQATPEEKKDFLTDVQGREEFQEVIEYKGKSEKRDVAPQAVEGRMLFEQKEEKAPFDVRESFWKKTGTQWENADEKEQAEFWREYKIEEKRKEIDEKNYLREKQLEEKKRKRERELEEKEIKQKKKLRE
jgi:hypothetical protein